MCLAVPGEVVETSDDPTGLKMGRVSFAGVVKDVCLACTPDAEPGDYVIVHAGLAISRLDEHEAMEVFALLDEIDPADAPPRDRPS